MESESAYPPETILPEAIRVLREKIASIKQAAEALLADSGADGAAPPGDGDVEMAGV